MHAILGSGGAVSPALAELLTNHHIPVRLVSRSAPPSPFGTPFAADIADPSEIRKAIEGCELAYLTVGLPYKLSVWEKQWPPLIQNVVDACSASGTRLIFVDNIYMLSDNSMPHIQEDSPMNPSSKKGKIRADVDRILLKGIESGKLQAIIARAADFYGYMSPNKSLLLDMVISRMAKGKSPQWMYTVDQKHAFTYIPDITQALYLMSTRSDAFNRIWNLPTAKPVTVRELIDITNRHLGKDLKPQIMSEFFMSLLRLFIPPLKEMKELKYQMVQDYWLDSTAFENFFNYKPTSYDEGIGHTLREIEREREKKFSLPFCILFNIHIDPSRLSE
jgi:nucleoside-diphosphate-sugar epimerase